MPAIEFEDLKLLGFDIAAYLSEITYLDDRSVFHPLYGIASSEESLQAFIVRDYINSTETPYEEWVNKQEPMRRAELENADWLKIWQLKVRYLQHLISAKKFKETGSVEGNKTADDFHCKSCGKNCANQHNLAIHSEGCQVKAKVVEVEVVLEPVKKEVRSQPQMRCSSV
jgi:hypothetical protein